MIRTGIRSTITIFVFAALPFFAFAETAAPAPAAKASAPKARPDIVGTVTDADGQPVAGAIVFVDRGRPKVGLGGCPTCYADCAKNATTDAQGRFRITDLDPTLRFNLLVTDSRHLPTEHSVDNPGAAAQTIRLQPVKGGESPDTRAVVRVLDAAGRPVPGATLSVEGVDAGFGDTSATVQAKAATDAEGRALIRATGPFHAINVKVRARGCAPRAARITSGDTVQEIRLANGATVSGRLLQNGQPVAGVRLDLVLKDKTPDNFVRLDEIATDHDGRFTFNGVPAGRTFQLSKTGESAAGTFIPRELTTGKNDTTLDLGDIALSSGYTVAGRVELTDGKPFPRPATLLLSREDSRGNATAELAPDGSFRFEHVAPGPVSLNLRIDGYRPTAGHSATPEPRYTIGGQLSGDKTDLVLRFEPGERLSRDEMRAAEPLVGLETTANPPTEPSAAATQAARAAVEAKERQYAEFAKSIQDYAEKVRLTGRIIEAGNPERPVAGATVIIKAAARFVPGAFAYHPWHETSLIGKSAVCDADGRFDLGPNPDGLNLTLTARAPGFKPVSTATSAGLSRPLELSRAAKAERKLPVIVVDAAGRPVPNASIRIASYRDDRKRGGGAYETWEETDDTGAARIPVGKNWNNIALRLSAPGFASMITAPLQPSDSPQTIRLLRGATVTGRIRRDGRPLAGIDVLADDTRGTFAGSMEDYLRTVTDAEGRFRITRLPTDRKLVIFPSPNSLSPYGVTADRLVEPLQDGQTLDLGDLSVTPGVKLAGRVVLTDGKPADNISISILHDGASHSFGRVRCDATGRFRFENLAPGEIRLGFDSGSEESDVPGEMTLCLSNSGESRDLYALTANNPCRSPSSPSIAVGRLTTDKTDLILEMSPLKPGEPDRAEKPKFPPLHGVEAAPAAK